VDRLHARGGEDGRPEPHAERVRAQAGGGAGIDTPCCASQAREPGVAPMQLSSVGKNHHEGKRVPARVLELAAGAPLVGDPERLKLVFLEAGHGVLSEAGAAEALVSPALALVGRAGEPSFTVSEGSCGLVLFFHPRYLNDELTFEALEMPGTLSPTGMQDRFLLRLFLDREELRGRIAQLEPLSAQRLAGFFEQLRGELERQPDGFWPCRSRSFFLQILLMLDQLLAAAPSAVPAALPAHQAVPWASSSTSDHALRPIVAYLVGHCHEELSVEALARVFATNRTTLQARFKNGTGLSIGQYVIRLRVHIAAHLLRDTSLSVAEVMERTGFNDPSHFARMFKRHTGRSPSDFRALFRVPGYISA
jgi:AraC family L-rhamnose operon regulatory protein RhaS